MMRVVAYSVLGFYMVGLSHAQPFSCQNNYDGTTDAKVKTQLITGANDKHCLDTDGKKTVPGLLGVCQKFCGKGRIPLLLGIPQTGFNQKLMDEFCLNTASNDNQNAMIHNQTLMGQCREWAKSFPELVDLTARFTGAVQNMERALLIFRADATEETQKMKKTMASDEIAKQMKRADGAAKMTEYLKILKKSLSGLVVDGPIMVDIKTAMQTVVDAGKALFKVINKIMQDVEKFSNQCGAVLLGVSQEQVYLADICMATGTKCINDEASTRVGCCCGVVPASGIMDIEASSRRLGTGNAYLDICGQAEELEKARKLVQLTKLGETTTGKTLLEETSAAKAAEFPDYAPYKQCPGRSLQGSVTEQFHQVDTPPSEAPNFHAHETRPRQLQFEANTGCSVVSNTTDQTKTSRWGSSVEYCDKMNTPDGQDLPDLLFNACSKYCGNAIPIVVGASQFGFGKDQMDGLCKNGAFLTMDANKVKTCHGYALTFSSLQTATAAFSTSVLTMESRKKRFEVAIKKAVDIIVKKFEAGLEKKINDAVPSKKIKIVKDMLGVALSELAGTSSTPDTDYAAIASSRKALDSSRTDISSKGAALRVEVQGSSDSLGRLLVECNTLFTGVGSSSEYLFDVCHQTAKVCIEQDEASHIGCCCGYLPLGELGKVKISASTICGDKCLESTGKQLVKSSEIEPPTMMSVSAADMVDICGKSTKDAKAALAEDANAMVVMGGEDILEEWGQGLATQYPAVYGDPCSVVVSTTTGDQTTNTAAGGGSDTAAGGGSDTANGCERTGHHSWVVAIVACIAIWF